MHTPTATIAPRIERPSREPRAPGLEVAADLGNHRRAPAARRIDPRLWQIGTLAGLLLYGMIALDFEIGWPQALVTLGAALLTQLALTRFFTDDRFEPRSALISGLSLCLLLRTNHLDIAFATAVVTIASKFLIRWRGKHVFNPTNFGVVAMMLATGSVWVSPGQWGNVAFFAFLMACVGGLVVNRAARSDVTYAFLASYLAIVFGYALWLGQPLATPLHRLENGALLLFSFFMISDPRTTPDSRPGRILFAMLVAALAAWIQFRMFRTNSLLWALAVLSPTVPLIDRLLPGDRHQWTPRVSPPPGSPEPGVRHETEPAVVHVPSPARA